MWCWRKLFESPLYCKEIQPVHPKGNQSWIFTGRTDTEAETPLLWPPVVKSQLIEKDPGPGKNWRQEEKGVTEDEMVGWHHWLDVQECEQTLGDIEGQGSLGVLQSMGLQIVGHDLATEQQQQKQLYSTHTKKRKRNLKCTVHSVKSYLISPANKKILLPNSRSLILAVNWCGHLYQLLMTAHIAIFTRSSLYLN